MITFADIGVPPWELPPGLVSHDQARFVLAALVHYVANHHAPVDNEDRNLLHHHIAIESGAKGRVLFQLTDPNGRVLDFNDTAKRLGRGGVSRWVTQAVPVFHESFGAFDPAEVYDRCITHYEVDSCQWMPSPAYVKAEFMTWSRPRQAGFMHYFIWWYDRDYYREALGIEAALAWLHARRVHLGRWQFSLRDRPLEQPAPHEVTTPAFEALNVLVSLFDACVNDLWTPSELYDDSRRSPSVRLRPLHSVSPGALSTRADVRRSMEA